jgi:hypothetical protein
MMTCKVLAAVAFGILATVTAAAAQAPAETPAPPLPARQSWNNLPDRVRLDGGYAFLDFDTSLKLQGSAGLANDVSFERDIGVPRTANSYWLGGTVRLSPRNHVKISYFNVERQGQPTTLTRDFTWEDGVYTAGFTATGKTGMELLSASFRFAIVRRDRFQIGLASGLGYLKLDAYLEAEGTLTGPTGQMQRVSLDGGGALAAPTGGLGGFVEVWVAKRVVVRGDYVYIGIKPANWEASVTDWRIAADMYPLRHLGFGVQFRSNEFRYLRSEETRTLGGTLKYDGVQVYASLLF